MEECALVSLWKELYNIKEHKDRKSKIVENSY